VIGTRRGHIIVEEQDDALLSTLHDSALHDEDWRVRRCALLSAVKCSEGLSASKQLSINTIKSYLEKTLSVTGKLLRDQNENMQMAAAIALINLAQIRLSSVIAVIQKERAQAERF
jgi:hypothetical protein